MEGSFGQVSRATNWQSALQGAVRSVDELLSLLQLRFEDVPDCDRESGFPLLVPREYIARMHPRDPRDPLLLQVLPRGLENSFASGFVSDPVGDLTSEAAPGLLHKYPSRVLMIATGICAVHCRYCFRRHFPYEETPKSFADWQPALRAIAEDSSVEEVILSGGDPLSLGNARLQQLVHAIDSIPHVRRLRFHTRFPLMIPSRIDEGFLELLRQTRLATLMVWHINHANEIDEHVTEAVGELRRAGVQLLNQSVLLRGINDSLDSQCLLSLRLVDIGILPYYLHQLDRVEGAAHFECSVDTGLALVAAMRERLPGYAVPRFVREIPGESSKTLLS
jgi:EF-P beta-lysylation protein EpmB